MRTFRIVSLISVLVLAVVLAAQPAGAVRPTEIFISDVGTDIDPCTGQTHTVTFEATLRIGEQRGAFVLTSQRTITTSPTGYVGHGTSTIVDNGQILVIQLHDILRNPAGDRVEATNQVVVDLSTGTAHVDRGGLVCKSR